MELIITEHSPFIRDTNLKHDSMQQERFATPDDTVILPVP